MEGLGSFFVRNCVPLIFSLSIVISCSIQKSRDSPLSTVTRPRSGRNKSGGSISSRAKGPLFFFKASRSTPVQVLQRSFLLNKEGASKVDHSRILCRGWPELPIPSSNKP